MWVLDQRIPFRVVFDVVSTVCLAAVSSLQNQWCKFIGIMVIVRHWGRLTFGYRVLVNKQRQQGPRLSQQFRRWRFVTCFLRFTELPLYLFLRKFLIELVGIHRFWGRKIGSREWWDSDSRFFWCEWRMTNRPSGKAGPKRKKSDDKQASSSHSHHLWQPVPVLARRKFFHQVPSIGSIKIGGSWQVLVLSNQASCKHPWTQPDSLRSNFFFGTQDFNQGGWNSWVATAQTTIAFHHHWMITLWPIVLNKNRRSGRMLARDSFAWIVNGFFY